MSLESLTLKDQEIYIKLIKQLSPFNYNITNEQFDDYLKSLPSNQKIYLLKIYDKIVGCGSILYYYKISHNFKMVGHIEDIVVDKEYRGMKYGKLLLDLLKEKCNENNCYKIILNCKDKYEEFYKKSGFNISGNEMRLDLE